MRKAFAYGIAFPFMLVGGVAYVAKVGFKSGWAWAEYFGEKYL
jgi:hypothetical protein